MKFKLIIFGLLLAISPVYAQNNGRDGGQLPSNATAVGGKGADGKFHFLLTGNDGALTLGLPSGASTAANQTTQNTKLDTIIANQTNGTQKTVAMPTQGAPTDRSGAITSGGTSQTLAAALSTRVYIEIQNISDETMYINFGAAATTDSNSFKIIAGGSYVNPQQFCPTGTITIIGATTGEKFIAKEYP
jgi:hypothetical protein